MNVPRKPNWPPRLKRKPGTTEARTYHAGRWWTCGTWDVDKGEATPAAKESHARLIAQWLADPGSAVRPAGEYLLAELLADWGESADGPETAEARRRLKRAASLLGPQLSAPAEAFTPAAFSAWRRTISEGRSRVTVKAYTLPVLRAYQWGEDAGRLPEGLAARLWAVSARGKSPGRAGVPRSPADPASVAAVAVWLAANRPLLAPLIRVHAATGARAGELLGLTVGDVRRSGVLRTPRGAKLDLDAEGVWAAEVREHKTKHAGGERVLVFGPNARKVLGPLLKGRSAGERLFRISPTIAGHHRYLRGVQAGCEACGVTPFVPRQLRQMVADRVRDALTGEHASAYLGHGPKGVTERHYLTVALGKAAEAARKVG